MYERDLKHFGFQFNGDQSLEKGTLHAGKEPRGILETIFGNCRYYLAKFLLEIVVLVSQLD